MGCFGDMEPTKQTNTQTSSHSVTAPAAWIENAGQKNYGVAQQILDNGYVPYNGTRVAPMSSDEIAAGNLVRNAASTGNPYQPETEASSRAYGAAPATNYDFHTVVDDSGPLGAFSSYMDPYIQQVLAPQLRQIGVSGAQARQGIDANAIQAGAFGDSRHGVVEGEQRKNQSLQEGDATGQAYSQAFNSAMGARQQDAGRYLTTQQAQDAADRASLERMRTSGIDLTNLDKYDVSRDLGLASALGGFGEEQRGLAQKQADVDYDTFRQQNGGFDKDTISWLTQLLAGTPSQKTTDTSGTQDATVSQPNNSGWQAIGSLASAILL